MNNLYLNNLYVNRLYVNNFRSSPGSLNSLSANNSEVDLVNLAENLAIKSNEKVGKLLSIVSIPAIQGDFAFDHPATSPDSTPVQARRTIPKDSKPGSSASTTTSSAKNSTFKMKVTTDG